MNNQLAIQSINLRKEFGTNVAVRGLNLEVQQGEVFGFLGPNGAGKTTSIKMFLGLAHPTSGSINILGKPVANPQVRSQVGFLPEHFRFHDWLTAKEFLTFHGQLLEISYANLRERVPALLEQVGLTPFANKFLRTFSKGMLQRIGLAQALINRPALVFLDEPTSGLDPVGRRLVRDIIRTVRDQGTTVFLNSHLLSEVEITCDRVAFIKHGEVLQTSKLSQLVEGDISLGIRGRHFPSDLETGLSRWSKEIRFDGENINMVVSGEENLPQINRYLVEQGVEIFAFTPQRISLEDLFIQIVGTDGGL